MFSISSNREYIIIDNIPHYKCKLCSEFKLASHYHVTIKNKLKSVCIHCYKTRKAYYQKHRVRKNNTEYNKNHYNKVKNSIEYIEYQKQYRKTYIRCKDNYTDYLIVQKLRNRVYKSLKVKNGTKSTKTLELLGCSIEELKIHLQSTAILNGYKDFDINNFSGLEYHIDHIIPCDSFDLTDPEQQRQCFHWSNHQILTAGENLSKGSKILS